MQVMQTGRSTLVHLDSGAPYHVELSVERVGRDLLCRVSGGEAHLGAVALSEWRDGRAHTRCLSAEGHREQAIARHAAHTLCAAARCTVSCLAGIHFDEVSRADVEAISEQSYDLSRRAAVVLRDARLREELAAEPGTFMSIEYGRSRFEDRLEEIFGASVESLLAAHAAEIAASLRDRFNRRVRLFAPLYLSNACTNDCVYCGFRRSSEFERTRLRAEEAVEQAQELAERGLRAIDLVTGEIPTDRFVDYVCRVTCAILQRTDIARIHLNLGSLSAEQYRRLRSAGALGYHLYQETYDPESFFRAHRAGGKREMASRLDAPSRAAAAGFEFVGLGVLLGLGDTRRDLASIAAHAALLREEHPNLALGFSLPRVQVMEADPDYAPEHPVEDDDFVRALLFLRLTFPEAHLTLTTRERPELRDKLLRCGITKISAGVSTAPGGYRPTVLREESGAGKGGPREQFRVSDGRSAEEIEERIRAAGLVPVYD